MSLVMCPAQWSWGQLKDQIDKRNYPTELAAESLPAEAARAFAFDTWVGQSDHGDHPHNIVFGYVPVDPPEYSTWIFLDYSFAFGWGGSWENDGALTCEAARFPSAMLNRIDESVLDRSVSDIESFDVDVIADVVDRIPNSHMADVDKVTIRDGLIARRALVRKAIASVRLE